MSVFNQTLGRYVRTKTSRLYLPLGSFYTVAAGLATPLVVFADADDPAPGLACDGGEALGIRWNNHATPTPVFTQIQIPEDRQDDTDMTFGFLAWKSGATVGDAVTFTTTAFAHAVAALYDADADFGGASSAMVGDAAAKTIQQVTRTLAAANIPNSHPSLLDLSFQPTDGLLGTDDVTAVPYIEYTAWDLFT